VISGPGTGKTFTFGKVLERHPGESLVITLINNLVDDMQHELGDLADVRTFHSLSRWLLHKHPYGGITTTFHFFPPLTQVISNDSWILSNGGLIGRGFDEDELCQAFRLLVDDDGRIDYFFERANYYDAVGFDDSVYCVNLLFRAQSEAVPKYHNVMVDEYQDFNALEVGVIASLEAVNRMLIVGDDDQSIYEFRQASPEFLQAKAADEKYKRFPLPYSTRCTAVIVSAVESIVKSAQYIGLLAGRLDKEFVCYLPDKRIDNENYPTIQAVTCSVQRGNAPYISRYIESVVSGVDTNEIAQAYEGEYPLALVVGPGHYLNQIHDYLHQRFQNVEYRPSSRLQYSVLDGFRLLEERDQSNLGWRILVEFLAPESLGHFIADSADTQAPLAELLEDEFKNEQFQRLDVISRAIEDSERLSFEEVRDLEVVFGQPYESILRMLGEPEEATPEEPDTEGPKAEPMQPTILLTNFNGCKGLSAGFTFVVGSEEGMFPIDNQSPSFTEICQLVVALTRTRKQCHLIHTRNFAGNWNTPSVFIDWISEDLVDYIEVNKGFF